MIILTAAALAAGQPAPAPLVPAGPSAGHADHAMHGQMQHGRDCPCCEHEGANAGGDCCDHMQRPNRPNRQ